MTNTDKALGLVLAFGLVMSAFCWFAAPLAWRKPGKAADPHQMDLTDLDGPVKH
jgi:hypothetical protein